MFDFIKKVLSAEPQAVPKNNVSKGRRIEVAACVVLLEAAHADDECTDEELSHVLEILKSTFDLTHEYAEELVELAHEERENAIDIWRFTNAINQHYSNDEKHMVIEAVWRVVLSDGELEKHEDYFARKLTNLLRLTHKEMIQTKLRVKDSLKNGA